MSVPPLHLGQTLTAQARLQPERIGARDLDRAVTYREWNTRANRLANALLGLGLAKGDRVAILAYNRLEWAEIYAAVAKVGLVAVPINFRLTSTEARYLVEDSGASALLVERSLVSIVEEVRASLAIPDERYVEIGADPTTVGYRSYEALLAAGASTEPAQTAALDDPWCLMYTSGTTGRPKGAIRGHRGMANLALMTAAELKLDRHDDALLVMPMCHANSLNFFTTFVYCGGAVTIFSRKSFDPTLCLATFAAGSSTFTSLVPTQYNMMLDAAVTERGSADFGRVEKLMISSAPARADTKRAVMDMFPNSGLFELYGSTEAGWVTMLHPHEQFDKLGSVGREVIGSSPIQLLDETGCEVPDGQPGELYSSSPYCFDGYWKLPKKTAEAFRGDYLTVGDIAVREHGGYIRLVDRKNNVIISGGENVYPSEVEIALADHPGVSDVAVVGRPDSKWGESVQAAVVRRPGQNVSEDDLFAWAKARLAGFKRPREIIFLNANEMPRNATGKILHRNLRQLLSERRASE
ncbi:MAG: AMP-binding protein [Gammaproteobacteria bacterium]|nr:AMP-binding protein [Gammaproteobacteria bacterium]